VIFEEAIASSPLPLPGKRIVFEIMKKPPYGGFQLETVTREIIRSPKI
jgi:hypothetical protein